MTLVGNIPDSPGDMMMYCRELLVFKLGGEEMICWNELSMDLAMAISLPVWSILVAVSL